MELLDQLYKEVLAGATLADDPQDYARRLCPAWSDRTGSGTASSQHAIPPGVEGRCQPPPVHAATDPVAPAPWKRGARDVTLLQLTVIQVMVSRALSAETERRAKERYREVLAALLQSADLDAQLIRTFQGSDKLLSHVAAKCLAWLLYFQLRGKNF